MLIDTFKNEIKLGKILGKGGEGEVYEILNRSHEVVKLTHNQKTMNHSLSEKLDEMIKISSNKLVNIAAWPRSIVYNSISKNPIGFTMEKLTQGKDIHILARPKDRYDHFPQANFSFLAHSALNLAICIDAIHEHSIVVGDMNESNFFVSAKNATVKALDTPSFQIQSKNKIYKCLVGKEEYTPPELQRTKFEDIERTANHDLFGLAVLIFQLLNFGRHPFQGIPNLSDGEEQPKTGEFISKCTYFYSNRMQSNIGKVPYGTLRPIEFLPLELSNLFERAFDEYGKISRPSAKEWYKNIKILIDDLDNNKKRCQANTKGHIYWSKLSQCPWCKLTSLGLRDPFWHLNLDNNQNLFLTLDLDEYDSPWISLCKLILDIRNINIENTKAISETLNKKILPEPLPISCNQPIEIIYDREEEKNKLIQIIKEKNQEKSKKTSAIYGEIKKSIFTFKFFIFFSLYLTISFKAQSILISITILIPILFILNVKGIANLILDLNHDEKIKSKIHFFDSHFIEIKNKGMLETAKKMAEYKESLKKECSKRHDYILNIKTKLELIEKEFIEIQKNIDLIENTIQSERNKRKQDFFNLIPRYKAEIKNSNQKEIERLLNSHLKKFQINEDFFIKKIKIPNIGETSINNLIKSGILNAADILHSKSAVYKVLGSQNRYIKIIAWAESKKSGFKPPSIIKIPADELAKINSNFIKNKISILEKERTEIKKSTNSIENKKKNLNSLLKNYIDNISKYKQAKVNHEFAQLTFTNFKN